MRIVLAIITGVVAMVFMLQFLLMSVVMADVSFLDADENKKSSCHEMMSVQEHSFDAYSHNPEKERDQKMVCCDYETIFSSSLVSLSAPKKNYKTSTKDPHLQKFLQILYAHTGESHYWFLRDEHSILGVLRQKYLENIVQKQEIFGFLAHKKIMVLLV